MIFGARNHPDCVMATHPAKVQSEVVVPHLDNERDCIVRDLIVLPLRVGAFATHVGVRITEQRLGAALSVARRFLDVAAPPPAGTARRYGILDSYDFDVVVARGPSVADRRPSPPPSAPAPAAPARAAEVEQAPPPAAPRRAAEAKRTAEAQDTSPVAELAPSHVSEQPRFVEAFAEPGAEDGAGAFVHIDEPWKGYAQMAANDVIAHLAAATREELAVVELYERSHRGRRTVLAAAKRQLQRAAAHGVNHGSGADHV
jgi:hypothetical protein